MKEKTNIILMGILVLLSGISIALNNNIVKEQEKTDAIKFKEEYEALNDKELGNLGKKYPTLKIKENNPMYYASYEEVLEVLDETAIIYLGYPECPWCRNLVPTLIDAANKTSINKIYYINMKDERNKLSLDENGEIKTEYEGTEGYKKLVEKLKDVLPVYEGLNDESIKRIYVPVVIFVKDGEVIKMHIDTVESQTDPLVELTKEQKAELKGILTDYMLEVSSSACTDAC